MAWIGGNRYLSKSEMENNAVEVYNNLSSYGWTLNSISAILGNMESESTINPNIWESLTYNPDRGYGLTQWTPSTKYTNWAGAEYENGDKQCERLKYEADNGLQWYPNKYAPIVTPPITFKEFTQSTDDVVTLATYFMWYYEQPTDLNQPNRGTQAQSWYEFLSGVAPTPPTPTPIEQNIKKMPVYMMCRHF